MAQPIEILPVSEKTHPIGSGIQKLYRFDNGYGASVVQFSIGLAGSYGVESGLWEMAVIAYDEGDEFHLTYDTPVTGDVLGYLDEDQVQDYLRQIRDLPPAMEVREPSIDDPVELPVEIRDHYGDSFCLDAHDDLTIRAFLGTLGVKDGRSGVFLNRDDLLRLARAAWQLAREVPDGE